MNNIYTITSIRFCIENKKQYVLFYLNNAYLNYNFSTNKTYNYIKFECKSSSIFKINLLKLELLIGSYFEPIYFDSENALPNGRIIKSNNRKYYIKSWHLKLMGTIEEIRERNNHLLLEFDVIRGFQVLYNDLLKIFGEKDEYLFTVTELQKLTDISVDEFILFVSVPKSRTV